MKSIAQTSQYRRIGEAKKRNRISPRVIAAHAIRITAKKAHPRWLPAKISGHAQLVKKVKQMLVREVDEVIVPFNDGSIKVETCAHPSGAVFRFENCDVVTGLCQKETRRQPHGPCTDDSNTHYTHLSSTTLLYFGCVNVSCIARAKGVGVTPNCLISSPVK